MAEERFLLYCSLFLFGIVALLVVLWILGGAIANEAASRMIKKKFSSRKNLLAIKQVPLLQQEEELHQREVLLRRQLQDLPAAVEEKRQHRYTKVARRATFFSWKLPGMFLGTSRRPTRNLPAKERRSAKIRFAILVFILASMVILIWRSIPS